LRTWVELGAPLRQHGVHQSTILNPHASGWHGGLAAQNGFGPITRASDPDVCGRCHEGAPVTPKGITLPAPGATACTHCHREPEGVLACGTCHGDGAARSYPPRPACFFAAARQDAHRAHVESTRLLLEPLRCTSCHPFEPAALGGGTHGNGSVDVLLDPAQAGTDAGYDAVSGQCNVRCHQRGGMRATPSFGEQGPLGCGDCHAAPPEKHYAGACNGCHAEVDAEGTALRDNRLHMNGTVDLGDGSGGCGACHGQGDDPWPATPSHRLHRDTTLTAAIACNECHRVPQNVNTSGHLDVGQITPAEISLGARAHARGQAANYENGTCRQVACHGAGLPEGIERALRWDAPLTHSCSGCHGLPPTRAHPADDGCATLICHGAEVSVGNGRPAISETGRNLHVNGAIDIAQH
jgi:predicted CxxxxCH...CXXCH cytochrome family protein